VYIRCYVDVVYAVLCTCSVVCMLYIWCCVQNYTSGDVSMWCRVHVIHVVLCACGVLYIVCT